MIQNLHNDIKNEERYLKNLLKTVHSLLKASSVYNNSEYVSLKDKFLNEIPQILKSLNYDQVERYNEIIKKFQSYLNEFRCKYTTNASSILKTKMEISLCKYIENLRIELFYLVNKVI